mgnify:CR=1 FL=1
MGKFSCSISYSQELFSFLRKFLPVSLNRGNDPYFSTQNMWRIFGFKARPNLALPINKNRLRLFAIPLCASLNSITGIIFFLERQNIIQSHRSKKARSFQLGLLFLSGLIAYSRRTIIPLYSITISKRSL